MATQKKIIGKLPVFRGKYNKDVVYYKHNIVTYLGSSFISTKDENMSAPCTVGDKEFILSSGWEFFSDSSEAYFMDERFDEMAEVTVTTDDESEVNDVEPDVVNEALRKTPQTLSKAEQAQARTNIGAASLEENNAFKAEVEEQVVSIDAKVSDIGSEVDFSKDGVYTNFISINNNIALKNGNVGGGIEVEDTKCAINLGYIIPPFNIGVNSGYQIRTVFQYILNDRGEISYFNFDISERGKTSLHLSDDRFVYKVTFGKNDTSEILESELTDVVAFCEGYLDYKLNECKEYASQLNKEISNRMEAVESLSSELVQNVNVDFLDSPKGYIDGLTGKLIAGSQFGISDFIDLNGVVKIDYCLSMFNNEEYGTHLGMVAFYSSNNEDSFISSIYGNDNIAEYNSEIYKNEFPKNAKYVRFTKLISNANHYVNLSVSKIADLENKMESVQSKIKEHYISFTTPYFGKNRINIIGDSITEGARSTRDYEDSYAGILRRFISAENGGNLNYGFAQYPFNDSFNIPETMVVGVNTTDFNINYNNNKTYGSRSLTGSTVGNYVAFGLRRKFKQIRICYLAGPSYGEIEVKALTYNGAYTNTTLATINCKSDTEEAMISEPIDISSYGVYENVNGLNNVYKIEVKSGTICFSGVMLEDNDDWVTFNNFGASGIPASTVFGDIWRKYTECDVLIYALGRNSDSDSLQRIVENQDFIGTVKNKRCKVIVLNLCFTANSYNGEHNSRVLKDFANKIDAKFIDLNAIAPKKENGDVVDDFFGGDYVHPSDMGYRFIAEAIAKAVGLSVSAKGVLPLLER